jgi:RNA polymerase sigma-70 factor (ECF subfamily)
MSVIDLHRCGDELLSARVARGRFCHSAALRDADADASIIAEAADRAKHGDRDALRYLYARYADNVYSYVATMVPDAHEAEDVTQQVFVKLMSVLHRYEAARGAFAPWLLRIARNVAIDHRRQLRSVPCEEVRAERRGGHAEAEDDRHRSMLLREVLAALPRDQREVVVLRHVIGLTPGEIADRLGKTESSVHGLHHRGRGALRTVLSQMESGAATRARAA